MNMLSLCHRINRQISWLHVFLALVAARNNTSSQLERDNVIIINPSMGMLVIILVCGFSIIGIIFTCVCRFHTLTVHQPSASGGCAAARGLDVSVIETFPVLLYSSVKELRIGNGTLECAVCLSEFEDNESLRLLPKCNHAFHPVCIDLWLSANVTCPVCRADLTLASGEPSKDVHSNTEFNRELSCGNVGTQQESNDQVVIDVNENCSSGMPIQGTIEESRLARAGIPVKFPRSHTTGHSVLIKRGENIERYTLRLPEEIRRQILTSEGMKRTRSYNVIFPREGSSRKGFRNGAGEESNGERWVYFMAASFVSKTESVMSEKLVEAMQKDRI